MEILKINGVGLYVFLQTVWIKVIYCLFCFHLSFYNDWLHLKIV